MFAESKLKADHSSIWACRNARYKFNVENSNTHTGKTG